MTRSPRIVAFSVLVVVSLAGVVGCADDEDENVVTIEPGDPVVIASLNAISGENASLGLDQLRTIEIAVEEKGELLGHPIELLSEDGECLAAGGTNAGQRLVSEEQLVGVIGTSCSDEAVPAAEILADESIVMISGSNTAPRLTSDLQGTEGDAHQPNYFRVAHNDIVQGQAAAEFAFEELGAQTAVTIHDGDPYTEGLATAFGNSFTELGGEVVLATAVGKDDNNMRPVLTEVAAEQPDIVFFPIFQPAADFLAEQAKEFPELDDPDRLMAADGVLADTFVELPQSENMYFSGPATPEGGAYEELVTKYEEAAGERPIQAYHAHSYDATNLLFSVIEEVAEEEDDGTLRIDRQELLDAMHDVEGFEGLTGSLACDEFGDCSDPHINIVRNTDQQETIEEVRNNILFSFEPEE